MAWARSGLATSGGVMCHRMCNTKVSSRLSVAKQTALTGATHSPPATWVKECMASTFLSSQSKKRAVPNILLKADVGGVCECAFSLCVALL